ncbi:MAG: hypothetical protein EBU46_09370 [Nitrosomonadaceae bacterium]|nr:hypothetical protein [Nitrosomonadaceae bacterium]
MINEELDTAVHDLCYAINDICLGSVERAVQDAAVRGLIANWNDHNQHAIIDEAAELKTWEEECSANP